MGSGLREGPSPVTNLVPTLHGGQRGGAATHIFRCTCPLDKGCSCPAPGASQHPGWPLGSLPCSSAVRLLGWLTLSCRPRWVGGAGRALPTPCPGQASWSLSRHPSGGRGCWVLAATVRVMEGPEPWDSPLCCVSAVPMVTTKTAWLPGRAPPRAGSRSTKLGATASWGQREAGRGGGRPGPGGPRTRGRTANCPGAGTAGPAAHAALPLRVKARRFRAGRHPGLASWGQQRNTSRPSRGCTVRPGH